LPWPDPINFGREGPQTFVTACLSIVEVGLVLSVLRDIGDVEFVLRGKTI
jgi:hypothetical protein